MRASYHARTLIGARRITLALAAVALVAAAQISLAAPSDADAAQLANLTAVTNSRLDQALRAPDVDFTAFNSVYIAQPTVSFADYWLKNNRREASPRYQAKIQKRYAELLSQALADAFDKDGRFTVASEPGGDRTLTVEAHISELDIAGPDDDPLIDYYVHRAGSAQLQLYIRAPQRDTVLVYAKDSDDTRERGIVKLQKTSQVENQRDFKFLMRKWAKRVVALI